MTLKTASAAALLALFAAACQPGEKTEPPKPELSPETASQAAPEVAPQAVAAAPSALTKFKTGQFAELDLDMDLPIPTASFTDAAGKPHSFADYKGKVVVYNIWAEWCGPCVEEMPTLVGLQKAFASKDVVVIPVAYGAGSKLETSAAKLKSLVGDALPFFFDAKVDVNPQAKTGALPATIIYDRSGKEAARLIYPAKWDAPDAIALVQAVLDGQS